MNYIEWHHKLSPPAQTIHGSLAFKRAVLAIAGFPIPPSLCLNAQAYRNFIQETGIYRNLQEILLVTDPDHNQSLETNRHLIHDLFRENAFPILLRKQLKTYYEALSTLSPQGKRDGALVELIMNEIGYKLPGDDILNARLGGCRHKLNLVRGIDDLEVMIKSEWSSFWTDWLGYWVEFPECDAINIDLAVNIQLHLEPEFCGHIGFDSENWSQEVSIQTSWGRWGIWFQCPWLPPHTYIQTKWDVVRIDRSTGGVIEYKIGSKQLYGSCDEDGHIIEHQVSSDRRNAPVLGEPHIQKLLELFSQAEASFGAPLALSWMFVDGQFFIIDMTTQVVD